MSIPVIDLHCDLLGCVENNEKILNFESPETNCSIPQLLQGNVGIQTFAIAVVKQEGSTHSSERQVQLYEKLLKQYPDHVKSVFKLSLDAEYLQCLFSIENALGLVEENESLDHAFNRFRRFSKIAKILYVSLTWNQENRFGGGNASDIGLKPDGKILLEFLSGQNVSIDLSHTSDALARDILNYIDHKSLKIVPIASHSNFRFVKHSLRNLPDDIAKEIIRLGGLIGINFVRRFIGDDEADFLKHIYHGLELSGENALCLGADFYGGMDIPANIMPERSFPTFQKEFANSSCYPKFLSFLQTAFPQEIVEKIAYKNALNFFQKIEIFSQIDRPHSLPQFLQP